MKIKENRVHQQLDGGMTDKNKEKLWIRTT